VIIRLNAVQSKNNDMSFRMFCPIRLSGDVYQRIIVVYSLKYRGAIETMEYCHAASSFRDVHTYKIRLKVFFVFVFVFVFFFSI